MKQGTRIFIYTLVAAAIAVWGSMVIIYGGGKESEAPLEHTRLGMIYLSEQSYEQAVMEFSDAIRIDPLDADAYLGAAQAYIAIGDTERAAEILEKGIGATGDVRLKSILEELLGADEAAEAVTEASTVSGIIVEKNKMAEFYPHMVFDDNVYFTIDIIDSNEAHIEIFSEIINDNVMIEYTNQIVDNAALMVCILDLDDIDIGAWVWNTPVLESWTWYKAYPQVFVHGKTHNLDISTWYTGNEPYHIYGEADTDEHKLSLDVLLPADTDFSFYDHEQAVLSAGIAEMYKGDME